MATLSRRSFVKSAALGGAAVGLAFESARAFAEDLDGSVLGSNGTVTQANDSNSKYQAIFDVVVVGAGCAGQSAALEAAQAGCKVALIEVLPNYYEANSSLCAGMIWGWNTPLQMEAGVEEESREDALRYLEVCGGGHDNPAMSEVFVDEADAQYDWLVGMGAEFPVDLITVFGAEYNFADLFPVRPHTLTCVQQSGRGITDVLNKACLEAGVEFIYGTQATNLITDPDGRVVGVVTPKGNFRGNKGVIICSSGFTKNPELVNGFIPNLAGSCAGQHSQGDGIVMGAAVGAKINNMWCMQAFSVGTMLKSGVAICNLVSAVNHINLEVGLDACRHYDEGMYYEDKYEAVIAQDGQVMWSIWDQDMTDQGASALFAPPCSDACEAEIADGVIVKADTIEELAEQMGVDPEVLAATVARYNKMAEAGLDEDFGRTTNLAPVDVAPFYAAKIVPVACDSAGGLVINTDAEVQNWAGESIPGLYAAGSTTCGWRGDVYPGCGTAISIGIIFGRHAGINAAAQAGSAYEGQLADDAGAYAEVETVAIETAENEYVGTGMGMGGEVKVKIAVEDGQIVSVEVVDQNETEGIGSRAVESMPATILEAQTYEVEDVSGATVSSQAIKGAVEDAMRQAGLL